MASYHNAQVKLLKTRPLAEGGVLEETRLFSFIQHYWRDFRSRAAARIRASQTSHNHFFHISDISFLIFWTYTTAEMTLPYSQSVTTLKSVTVGEPSTQTVFTSTPVGLSEGSTTYRTVNLGGAQLQPSSPIGISDGSTTYRTVNLGGAQLQPVQYINSQMEGNVMYGGARYLVPVQQRPAESLVYLSQAQAPRVMQQVYLQNVQPMSVSSVDETDVYRQVNINGQTSFYSQLSSPVKSPEPSESELVESSSIREEVVDLREIKNGFSSEIKTEVIEVEPVAKLDNRFFGELLAEVYRKNSDIHTCISEHVAKIRGRKHLLDPTIDYKVEKEEIESLIPKGVSELTKQQIRYLLQTRVTADKTMRLLMATFSSLREELVHMQEDLRRLESEKEELERDLSFKADQALQYDRLLETVREHNRQLQAAVKESNNAQRTLESQLMTFQSKDPSKDFRIKELEGSKRALEQENELLRKKLAGQCSSSTIQIKTQELSREYEQMLNDLREEKDKELKNLRTQLIKIQTERTITHTTDSTLELRITELLSKLEQRESVIRHQEEEIKRLKQQKVDNSSSTTRTVVTKRYMNQYPILGLLSDDYQYTPPIKEDRTVVIERTGEVTTRLI
ncbi:protein POF1B [Megalobrama amblycephala]|uniref:protein POF1B n=1 Tax=Megalobrama amblycephala TaxID=75352 RepID=UPI002013FC21|nr:protein POF1B [Megalobrama amblycephala]